MTQIQEPAVTTGPVGTGQTQADEHDVAGHDGDEDLAEAEQADRVHDAGDDGQDDERRQDDAPVHLDAGGRFGHLRNIPA